VSSATAISADLAPTRRWRPRVTHERPAVDLAAAVHAAADLLAALGLDLTDENLADTPRRMAHALVEMTSGPDFELTTFPNDEGYDELVLVQGIALQSVCEHHMLPFVGVAHVGYLPGDRILGLSKLARVVEMFARRPQVQERLTQQVADWLSDNLAPRGVGVVVEAEHLCMTMRGVRAGGASTVTSAVHGQLRHDGRSRAEFFALAAHRPDGA
jgi:GTP cyclohydrolase I